MREAIEGLPIKNSSERIFSIGPASYECYTGEPGTVFMETRDVGYAAITDYILVVPGRPDIILSRIVDPK